MINNIQNNLLFSRAKALSPNVTALDASKTADSAPSSKFQQEMQKSADVPQDKMTVMLPRDTSGFLDLKLLEFDPAGIQPAEVTHKKFAEKHPEHRAKFSSDKDAHDAYYLRLSLIGDHMHSDYLDSVDYYNMSFEALKAGSDAYNQAITDKQNNRPTEAIFKYGDDIIGSIGAGVITAKSNIHMDFSDLNTDNEIIERMEKLLNDHYHGNIETIRFEKHNAPTHLEIMNEMFGRSGNADFAPATKVLPPTKLQSIYANKADEAQDQLSSVYRPQAYQMQDRRFGGYAGVIQTHFKNYY